MRTKGTHEVIVPLARTKGAYEIKRGEEEFRVRATSAGQVREYLQGTGFDFGYIGRDDQFSDFDFDLPGDGPAMNHRLSEIPIPIP